MNQKSNRICKRKGHDQYPIFHICILLECSEPTRWCCSECISQGIHNHNKPNNSCVMKTREFLIKLKSEADIFKANLDGHKKIELLKFKIQECLRLEESLRNQILNITEQQEKFQSYLNYLDQNKFESLDDVKLNKLLKINLQQFNPNQQLLPLDHILQVESIEYIIKEPLDDQNDISNKIIDLQNTKDKKYITQEIDETRGDYYGSSISRNEYYLAYGGSNELLKIYDIKSKKIIKEIKQDCYIWVCQFTHDSSQLHVGLSNGYVMVYDVQDNFKQICQLKIHQQAINNIITIKNQYLITCSDDKSIIKTDIKSIKQIFKLTGHTKEIHAIDYNDKDQLIFSDNRSIKLWDCSSKSIIINKEQSHGKEIRQIQFINKNLNILSLDLDGNLYKWKIDLDNKDLIKLQQFIDQNTIFNFYQVNQDQNILLICKNYVKIVNQQGEIINTIIIEHDGQNNYCLDCRQLDNLKYIWIRTQKKIILVTAQECATI